MGNFRQDGKSGPRRDFRRREMHKAVCSKCGKDCEVPFEPTGGKPVYCSECFEKRGGGTSLRKPQPQNFEQFEAIKIRLDKIIELLTITPKKTKTLKKKTPVKKE